MAEGLITSQATPQNLDRQDVAEIHSTLLFAICAKWQRFKLATVLAAEFPALAQVGEQSEEPLCAVSRELPGQESLRCGVSDFPVQFAGKGRTTGRISLRYVSYVSKLT